MLFTKFFTLLVFFITGISTVQADFHKWDINELFSNADGSIQFIELFTPADGQELLNTGPDVAQLSSTDGLTTHLMASFPNDLPSDLTADKFFLIATTGFAGLTGAVTPDYTMPDGFLFIDGGTVVFADMFDPLSTVSYGTLPIDGILSLNADGSTTGTNSPTNFAGATGSIVASAVVPVPPAAWLFVSGLLGLVAVARRRGS
jgi:hypothetical protein